MIILIIFVCGITGAVASARKDMLQALAGLLCKSVAVYAALLFSPGIVGYIPELSFSWGNFARVSIVLIVLYVGVLIFMSKLSETCLPEPLVTDEEPAVPPLVNKIFSRVFGFFSGCVVAYLLLIVLVWGAFTFKLPTVGEKDFRDSVQANVLFFTGTMNVFTWSSSYAPVQKKQIHKLFPEDKPVAAVKDKLSSLSESGKKALTEKKSKKLKRKKRVKKRASSHIKTENRKEPADNEKETQKNDQSSPNDGKTASGEPVKKVSYRNFPSPCFSCSAVALQQEGAVS